jgi:hypothetical protein
MLAQRARELGRVQLGVALADRLRLGQPEQLLARVVEEQVAALEVLRVDHRRAVVHQPAQAVGRALELGLGLLARLDVGARLDLGQNGRGEVVEDLDVARLPGARPGVGDGQGADDEAAVQPQRDAGVGEDLARVHDREVAGQRVLAGVADDERLARDHDVLAEGLRGRHAPGLDELGLPEAGLDVEVAVVEQRDHRDRRLQHLAREAGEAVEGVLRRRAEHAGGAQQREPHGVGQGIAHARAGHCRSHRHRCCAG